MRFEPSDDKDLELRGITTAQVAEIVYRFTNQTLPIILERPCTSGDGIVVLKASESNYYQEFFDAKSGSNSILKFVPASGAASRMFKHLYNYKESNTDELTEEFIVNFDLFPFYTELQNQLLKKGISLTALIEENKWRDIFNFILEEPLRYGHFPKGLIPFHAYEGGVTRTAFEEHMFEAVDYGREEDGTCRIHFTLAPHQVDNVMAYLKEKATHFPYEKFVLNHSIQLASTDTPAIDRANELVRDASNKIVFRPAGHGALIFNLQNLTEDIIFIKNIDNVTNSSQKGESIFYKKVLAGLLIELKENTDRILKNIDVFGDEQIQEALRFIGKWFVADVSFGMSLEQSRQFIKHQLSRPIRVCGMVKNEGEPGGGPFWVKSSDGYISKQIVEKSQVDHHNVKQMKVLSGATHFNPVDIVCTIKDEHGNVYDLQKYIDHSSGFISEKFLDGKVIKALELPGLWNGSMALWNTVFVEVPVATFNPVKTVNDLLRPGHQPACD